MDKDADWKLLLLYLFQKTNKLWRDYEKEVKYSNRFFPKSELLDEIKRIQKYAIYNVEQGELFYRARLFNSHWEYYKSELSEIAQVILKYYPQIGTTDSLFDTDNASDIYTYLMALACSGNINQSLITAVSSLARYKS